MKRIKLYSERGNLFPAYTEWKLAIAAYDAAIAIKPDYHEAIYNKARAYARQGAIEPALENLKRAFHLNPDEYSKMAKTKTDFDPIRADPRFQALLRENQV